MKPAYSVPLRNRLMRRLLLPIFRQVFHLLGRVKLKGLEHVPKTGAYLIAYNHVSIYDPPFIAAFWPTAPEVLGAVEIWSRPGQDLLARLYGGIPIRRGEVDRTSMQTMLAALRSGYALLVSPEGGRSHQPGLRQAKPGVTYLIDQTHVPVIAAGVVGTTDDFFRRARRGERPLLRLTVGEPFMLPEIDTEGLSPKEIRQCRADYLMERLAAVLPPEYRGVYAQPEILG